MNDVHGTVLLWYLRTREVKTEIAGRLNTGDERKRMDTPLKNN